MRFGLIDLALHLLLAILLVVNVIAQVCIAMM